ncbi:MAG: DUF3303 domain-containing protein [Chloroflexi bacterium]|nr:DUF3303 domain-containing protein [Chloroflexota bacterium]
MLLVTMAKAKAGTGQERITRRAQWKYPDGMRVLAEYWPIGGEYEAIIISEGDNITSAMALFVVAWSDVLDITITPALTAEEGLRLAQQMHMVKS